MPIHAFGNINICTINTEHVIPSYKSVRLQNRIQLYINALYRYTYMNTLGWKIL